MLIPEILNALKAMADNYEAVSQATFTRKSIDNVPFAVEYGNENTSNDEEYFDMLKSRANITAKTIKAFIATFENQTIVNVSRMKDLIIRFYDALVNWDAMFDICFNSNLSYKNSLNTRMREAVGDIDRLLRSIENSAPNYQFDTNSLVEIHNVIAPIREFGCYIPDFKSDEATLEQKVTNIELVMYKLILLYKSLGLMESDSCFNEHYKIVMDIKERATTETPSELPKVPQEANKPCAPYPNGVPCHINSTTH